MRKVNLNRTQILEGAYEYPEDLIKLKYTNHVTGRLAQRGIGIECIPSLVRVTKDNVYCGKTEDNKTLCSVVVRLKYTSKRNLFLCFNPRDGGLKTLWFKEK